MMIQALIDNRPEWKQSWDRLCRTETVRRMIALRGESQVKLAYASQLVLFQFQSLDRIEKSFLIMAALAAITQGGFDPPQPRPDKPYVSPRALGTLYLN